MVLCYCNFRKIEAVLLGNHPITEPSHDFFFVMILWDPKTTIKIGLVTAYDCLVVIFEGAFDLYG